MLEKVKTCLVADHRNIAHSCLCYHIMCVIGFIDRNGNAIGLGSHLNSGIGDAAVHLLAPHRRAYKQSIR